MTKMVTIPEEEYERLKELAEEAEAIRSVDRALKDVQAGRIIRVR